MLLARSQRIACMSVFLAVDYVIGFTPIPMVVWGLDFIMLFMVWSLCGWRLALTWYGLSFLPTLPNLVATNGGVWSVASNTLNQPVKPQPLPGWEVPIHDFLLAWFTNMQPWVQFILPWLLLAFALGMEANFFRQLRDSARVYMVTIAPPLKSRLDPESYQNYAKLKKEMDERKEKRRLRRQRWKAKFRLSKHL